MNIIGFAQLHNELESGNLLNWFKCMDSICSKIYIYDQGSTDNSKEEYKKHNTFVIESSTNNFNNEISCKSLLLKKLLQQESNVDWIFWMDGDTLLEKYLLEPGVLESICANTKEDAIVLGHYNLWRSDLYYRTDSLYHWLHENGVVCLWKNNGKLNFPIEGGMHLPQYPLQLKTMNRLNYSLIHRGFVTDLNIIQKYLRYKSYGQNGFSLDRLLDEKTLSVNLLPDILPGWFEVQENENPINKQKLLDLYKEML